MFIALPDLPQISTEDQLLDLILVFLLHFTSRYNSKYIVKYRQCTVRLTKFKKCCHCDCINNTSARTMSGLILLFLVANWLYYYINTQHLPLPFFFYFFPLVTVPSTISFPCCSWITATYWPALHWLLALPCYFMNAQVGHCIDCHFECSIACYIECCINDPIYCFLPHPLPYMPFKHCWYS